jgi:raffinose/stachyose/melibiose transport system permease protein
VTAARLRLRAVEAACVALAAAVVVPFLMIAVNSLKDIREAALFRLTLPTKWMWSNYVQVLSESGIARGFANSVGLATAVVVVDDLLAALAAFVIQRRKGALRYLYYLFFLGLIAPVAIVPTIRLMMDLRIHNTYTGIVLYYAATVLPFSVFVLTGFMKSLPRELDEAALMEGCGYLRLFFRIIAPLIGPAVVTVTIVAATAVWDDFLGPFYLISDSRKWTIILKIFSFMSQYQTEWGLVFAFMMLVLAPVLAVYLLLQRYIIDGLTAGSLKG